MSSNQTIVHIRHANTPGQRIPDGSILSSIPHEDRPNGLKLEVSHGNMSCFFIATNSSKIHVYYQDKVYAFGPTIDASQDPEFLTSSKPYIRKELLKLLRKLCRPTSILLLEEDWIQPGSAQRNRIIKSLNYEVLLGYCQILEIKLTRLPKPIYSLCIINNL